jgi:hypothetical protein
MRREASTKDANGNDNQYKNSKQQGLPLALELV